MVVSSRVDDSRANWLHLLPGMTIKSKRMKLINHYRTMWTKEWLNSSAGDPCLILSKELFLADNDETLNVRLGLLGNRGIFYIESREVTSFDWKIVSK